MGEKSPPSILFVPAYSYIFCCGSCKYKKKKNLKSHRCFWRTPITLGKIYLYYCTLKFHNKIFITLKMWSQIFNLAVQSHGKMGLITSATNWKK